MINLALSQGLEMSMDVITIARAKVIAKNQGIKPGRVKGTEGVQFTKGQNPRIQEISWEDFEKALAKRGLAIYATGTWMKIMKAPKK